MSASKQRKIVELHEALRQMTADRDIYKAQVALLIKAQEVTTEREGSIAFQSKEDAPKTLRDEFAMAALVGDLGYSLAHQYKKAEDAARSAYKYADAMLAQRRLPHAQ